MIITERFGAPISADHKIVGEEQESGIAERAVRRVKEGTSSVWVQSGLQKSWCAQATECY